MSTSLTTLNFIYRNVLSLNTPSSTRLHMDTVAGGRGKIAHEAGFKCKHSSGRNGKVKVEHEHENHQKEIIDDLRPQVSVRICSLNVGHFSSVLDQFRVVRMILNVFSPPFSSFSILDKYWNIAPFVFIEQLRMCGSSSNCAAQASNHLHVDVLVWLDFLRPRT